MYIYTIVLEGSVYIGGYYDTHMALLKQLNIQDTEKNRKTKFVKCWFKIDDRDIYNSINEIDGGAIKAFQDELPPWFNKENTLEKTKEAFKKWYGKHVFVDQEIKELSSGYYYLSNCKVECLFGNVEIEICRNYQIDLMLDRAKIMWCYNTQIGEMFDESQIKSGNSSKVLFVCDESDIQSKGIKLIYDYRKKKES